VCHCESLTQAYGRQWNFVFGHWMENNLQPKAEYLRGGTSPTISNFGGPARVGLRRIVWRELGGRWEAVSEGCELGFDVRAKGGYLGDSSEMERTES
jgi:hypothetical protein